MSVIQFADDTALPSTTPRTFPRTAPASRRDEILALRQNAAEILCRLRDVRDTWSEADAPPPRERWMLRQVLHCLAASRNPPAGDEFDRIAAAGEVLSLLMDLPDVAFEAEASDGEGYDLVDFDADLDDADSLAGEDAA
ncbi:hypothetical protein KXR53_15795 [Inquilinus limosus]|uniref:hypothetical protein n=1 Tax=Inquilinus limosus TaxID=171674 RepID=UPI003F13E977